MIVLGVETSSINRRSRIARATVAALLLALLSGCGSTPKSGATTHASATAYTYAASAPGSCQATVLATLRRVLARIYHEGIASERTAAASNLIEHSAALRKAVEADDPAGARAAAQALVATGHLTNLRVIRGTQTLAQVGGPALTPHSGTLKGAGGAPIASYLFSVWSDSGFISEANGVAGGSVSLREHGRSVGGSFPLAPGTLPAQGTLTHGGAVYQYTSFPAAAYPSGSLRIYVLKPLGSAGELCGSSDEDTVVNTLSHVATLIYAGEAGARTQPQVQRVQGNQALLQAVARQDPAATREAIESLLNEHIVRLRVSAAGKLLADVGGPYVLAPVSAPLRLNGRTIGSFVLSIQDDEGYLRLTRRLAGLDVLMYMNTSSGHGQVVKNSLGPAPGAVPDSGSYTYRGRRFRIFTLHAHAFPSGPLIIHVLIPIPYS